MKLIEYRFPKTALMHSSQAALSIQSVFVTNGEERVQFIFSIPDVGGIERVVGHVGDIFSYAKTSFEQTFSDVVSYEDFVSIRSMESCRFVVFEDGGVVRFCLSTEDETSLFGDLEVEEREISKLLIETDLFDYL